MSRLTINSNIASLSAQRNFAIATKKLSESYTRLSSGHRINKASDDAAGLSISESLKADTRLFNQGVRNLNDGVSLLNIADSALGELSNISIRLRELATQSANGALGSKQRSALDQEAQALSKEYNRIARTTEFNGQKLFNADFRDLNLVAGGGRESIVSDGLGGAVGEGTFLTCTTYASGFNPTDVVTTDLNGDGVLDLVTTDQALAAVSVLLGNSDGSFKGRTSFVTGLNPQSLDTGDFNDDGIVDLVITDYGSNTISIFQGNGDGTYRRRVSYAAGNNPYAVVSSDINSDGILDLITTDYASGTMSVYRGNGNGTFNSRVSYSTNSLPVNVLSADFDGDGVVDIVTADANSNAISVFRGIGGGSFSTGVSYLTGSAITGAGPFGLTSGDFNSDGIIDLATSNRDTDNISVFLGNNNGSFKGSVTYAAGDVVLDINVGDFNGDGILDFVTADAGTTAISIVIGNADGTFKSRTTFGTVTNTGKVVVADFNLDGVSDIATTSISVLFGNSTDGISALQKFSLKSKSESKSVMSYMEQVLKRLIQQRGHIGAFQSRVETATSNLKQSALAYSEANSRITDAEIAEESSKLVANQILQQAAASVLAQANQQPRLVLNLLQVI